LLPNRTVDLKDLRPGELELFNAEENSGDGDKFDEDAEVKKKYLTSTRFLEDERSDEGKPPCSVGIHATANKENNACPTQNTFLQTSF